MHPCLDLRKPHLREGESTVTYMDGVGEHLSYLKDEKLAADLRAQMREFIKLAANATGSIQVHIGSVNTLINDNMLCCRCVI